MILVLLNLLLVQGHVQMFYDSGITGSTATSIRNAGTPQANGQFSTAGPCGGATNFGGASGTHITNIDTGAEVYLKIQYNGGHRSPDNEFAVRMLCKARGSGPTQAEMLATPDLATGVCRVTSCPTDDAYPCPATNGNAFQPGYIFNCAIPYSEAGKDCTFSVLDQRNWGGCVDFRVATNPPTTSSPETTTSTSTSTADGTAVPEVTQAPNFPLASSGTYKFYGGDVNIASPLYASCCCALESANANKNTFVVSGAGVLTGTFDLVCPPEITTHRNISSSQTDVDLQLTYVGEGPNWEGSMNITGQEITFNVIANALFYTNTDEAQPFICDGFIRQEGTGGTQQTYSTSDCAFMAISESLGSDASTFSLFVLFAFVVALW